MLRVHESLLRLVVGPLCMDLGCPADRRDIVWSRLRLDYIAPKLRSTLVGQSDKGT